jgi:hypothetical protein
VKIVAVKAKLGRKLNITLLVTFFARIWTNSAKEIFPELGLRKLRSYGFYASGSDNFYRRFRKGFLITEDGTDRLSQNVGKKLPTLAA